MSQAEIDQINNLNTQKLQAEISKMIAETNKINGESFYYPMVVSSGATVALIAFVKLFL